MKFRHLIIYMFALCLLSCTESKTHKDLDRPAVDTIPMMVMQIQKCSRLYTSEYQLHKIVTYRDTAALRGKLFNQSFRIALPASQRHIAIPVEATVKASIDFSHFTEDNVKKHGKKIEIILPDPELTMTSTRIDHKGVKEKVSLFRQHFTDEEVTHIQQQGRQDILKTIPQLDIMENARLSAARQIIPILEQMGYREEDITVTFRKKFSDNDIFSLIKQVE
jgi:hypothetical protein